MHGLADPVSKIRVVCAYVVSKIAHEDFPEDWPNLFDILLSYLKSNSAHSVHGAMRVLLEMVKNDISIQQLPQVGSVLLPELFTIVTSSADAYSFRTRGRAVSILNSCAQALSILREDAAAPSAAAAADQFIGPILPQWLQAFHAILSHHVTDDAEKATEEYGLKMEVVRVSIMITSSFRVHPLTTIEQCIVRLSGAFPSYIVSSLPQLIEPIWMDLYNLRERYVAEVVSDSAEETESFQDSDGNEIGFQSLLYALLEFVQSACAKKSIRHLFVTDGAPTSFLEQLIYVLIVYMQITQEQAEAWSVDANKYVADEEEATYTYNTRVAALDTLSVSFCSCFLSFGRDRLAYEILVMIEPRHVVPGTLLHSASVGCPAPH